MELLLPIFSGVIILLVIFTTSILARIFKAKRHKVYWMVFPWIISIVSIIAANIFQLDGLYVLVIGVSTFIIVLEILNGMKLSSAITITVSSVSMLILFFVGMFYGLNQSGTNIHSFTEGAVGLIPQSKYYNVSFLENLDKKKSIGLLLDTEEIPVIYSEQDLLPNRVVRKPVAIASIYHVINPRKAGSMRGAKMRLLKNDGKLLKGSIVGVEGNKLIIGRYVPKKGMIEARIRMNLIKKLEVMRR